ncbi:MAG TPA: hypothetical protein VH796_18720 [Nitrososphaeraceae archaeon]|jgi:hypothetical protein
MSIKFLSIGTTGTGGLRSYLAGHTDEISGLKNVLCSYIRGHSNEIAIIGIMSAIMVGVAAVASGDVMEALARGGRR